MRNVLSNLLRGIVFILILGGGFLLADGCWIKAKAVLAQLLLQHAWEESVSHQGTVNRPWPWADTWPVARLEVPRLGVDLIVLEGESGEVLAFGPGHLSASSAPGGGGHTILAGHRDTSFKFLQELRMGDSILLHTAHNGVLSYRVQNTLVRDAEDLYFEDSQSSALTLLTCYPFDGLVAGTLRFLVFARLES
jgi:sortase A